MTAVTGTRFDITDMQAGTVAINALAITSTDKVVFGVIGNEMIVFKVPIWS